MTDYSAINAVYYPSWRVYKDLPPSSLEVQCITHVFYAFIRINKDGSLRLLDEAADTQVEADGEKGCLNALAKLKRQHPHLRTIISVGGGGGCEEFPAVAAQAKTRETLARSMREFADRYAFDGVDIDWEHPETPEQGRDYLLLLQALRAHLPAPRYLLTSALPVAAYCLKLLDLSALANVLDLLNLMCYDYTGPWTDVSGHHAQLLPPARPHEVPPALRRSSHHGVDYLVARGFPRAKILMGVPAYARCFARARAPGHPFGKSECAEMDYCDLPNEWVRDARVDEEVGAAWFNDEGGKGFVSFDVPATVRQKAGYARAMGLAGLFYWTGVGDRAGGESLVAAGWKGLREL